MWIPFPVDTDNRLGRLDPPLKDRIRAEQMDVALRLAPFTILLTVSAVQVITYLFWRSAAHVQLAAFDAVILVLAAVALERCWRWRSREKCAAVAGVTEKNVVSLALLYGALLGAIPAMLILPANPQERLLLASCCTGFIGTSMSLAVMPRAAIAFSGPIVLGGYVSMALTHLPFDIYVAILLTFYSAFIFLTIVHTSRLLVVRVIAQDDLERQREVTNLLLNDFEENASDWLWETDASLNLQHVSTRFVKVAGSSERALQGLPLDRLLLSSIGSGAASPSDALWRQIEDRRAFRDMLVPIQIAGSERYWSLSGKPIFDRAGVFAGYRGVGSDVTEKKQSEDRLSYLALHDSLTDLPNRGSFHQGLAAAVARLAAGERFAVFCLDLDEFKSVNDTFGHAAGDALLRTVAARLRSLADPDMLIARLAGDEFAMLVKGPSVRDKRRVEALAKDIVKTLGAPYYLEGASLNVGVSVGVAIAPEDGASQIMRRADLALYRVKHGGRRGYRFYEAEMDERIDAARALTADLRRAVDRNEFVLVFQPLVSAADGAIQGFEALIRWRHPRRGEISPGEFIPVAEETGVIIALGEWILKEACRLAATWPLPVSVAVNLSPKQFRHSDVPAIVRAALKESGLAAERLELEVTESVFLEATPAIRAMLAALRDMRVRLSLDDFGTGYSSLSYLRRIAFDKLKIDQCFVRELPHQQGDLAIVRSIVELASTLGMTVAAEGVETEAQRACLQQNGCHQFQGYLFSKPVPAEAVAALATNRRLEPKRSQAA
jgi:diguanylate cyclase (GGDEF)-like protein/PAS domain S-box-containing protein